MEIFNFLWLIWNNYLPKAPKKNNRPLDPRSHHHTLCFFDPRSPKQPKNQMNKVFFFSKIKIAYFIIIAS